MPPKASEDSQEKNKRRGGLYPTVAVSDAVNTVAHAYAAYITYNRVSYTGFAALGFGAVAVASFVGTLRFGFSEDLFAKANNDLANVAAFCGLPLVGLAYYLRHGALAGLSPVEVVGFVLGCSAIAAAVNSLSERKAELLRLLFNVFFFIGPIFGCVYAGKAGRMALAGGLLFPFAGVAITPDRERCFAGMRRENWFHYAIAAASVMLAKGLCQ